MITLLRYVIIIVMSAFLVVAAMNYEYFICGPEGQDCLSGYSWQPSPETIVAPSYSQSHTSGGGTRER